MRDEERRNVCERRPRYVERKGVITQGTEQKTKIVIGDVRHDYQSPQEVRRAMRCDCVKACNRPLTPTSVLVFVAMPSGQCTRI